MKSDLDPDLEPLSYQTLFMAHALIWHFVSVSSRYMLYLDFGICLVHPAKCCFNNNLPESQSKAPTI